MCVECHLVITFMLGLHGYGIPNILLDGNDTYRI